MKLTLRSFTTILLPTALTLSLLLAGGSSRAAIWTNTGGATLRWGATTNWSPNTAPNANDAVADFQFNLPSSLTIGVCSATGGNLQDTLGTLKLGSTNGTAAITLNKGGASTSRIHLTNTLGSTLIEKRGNGNDTISVGTVWMNNMTISFAGGTGTLTFSCGNANLTEQPAASGRVLTVTGAGTLVFLGTDASTYSGGTVISNQAAFQIALDTHVGPVPGSPTSSNVIIANGGKLVGGATIALAANRGILLKGGTAGLGAATNNQTFTIGGPITTDPSNPASLLVSGPGTVAFGGAATPTTDTTVTSGTLAIATGSGGSLTTTNGLYLASGSALRFDCPSGNLVSTPMTVGTLSVTNTVKINVSGAGLSLGQFTLIQYASLANDGFAGIQLGTLPTGVVGHLVNTGTTIDLVVDALVNSLTWTGATDGNWDTTTLNWNPNVAYSNQYGSSLIGDIVRFDDSVGVGPTNINLTTALQPATLTVDNSGVNYSFSGPGKLTRTTALTKNSGGTLKLQTANDYSGGSTLNGGLVQIGQDNALGAGAVNLNGSSITSDSTSPHSISNSFSVTVDTTFGDTANNGKLTLGGNLDFLNASRNLRFDSDVVVTGTMGNGIFNKDGLGTLTIKGLANFTKLDHTTLNGTVIFDGGIVTNNLFGWRIACSAPASVSRLVITNNGLLNIDNSQKQSLNLRVGNTGGNNTSTNIVDFWSGQIILMGGATGGSAFIGHTDSARGIFNLNGGTLLCQRVTPGAVGAVSEFNFNGGMVRLSGANFLTSFMQGLTEVYVRSGGGFIDTAGYDVTLAQSLLDAGGGLTKSGAGTLYLNGNNTYTGTTLISAGGLGGTGIISGPVVVSASGTFKPGNSVGTLFISNSLSLQGVTVMELSKSGNVLSCDLVAGVTSLSCGGALIVTNTGIGTLRSGDTFKLFDAASISGSFASTSAPPLLPGLGWDFSQLMTSGSVSVVGTLIPPRFTALSYTGSNVSLVGTNGVAGGTYYILSSTSLDVPVASWTAVATNQFNSSGNFALSLPVNSGEPSRFFALQLP